MNTTGTIALSSAAAVATTAWLLAASSLSANQIVAANSMVPPAFVGVCVGADSNLRIASPGGGCPAGKAPLPVSLDPPGTLGPNDAPSNDSAVPAKSDGLEGRLADLERRVAELEKTALFEVVDKDKHVIFSVAPQNVRVYDEKQALVFAVSAASGAGQMTAWWDDGSFESSAGVFGMRAGLWISENGTTRVDAGRREAGNYSLRLLSAGGDAVAGIGQSTSGTGSLVVNDNDGNLRALMGFENRRPTMLLFNSDGKGLLSLAESTIGSGIFTLADKGGEPMVKMVVNENKYGAVLAGPVAGFPLVPSSGLPGSYILGCAGGPSCHP